MLRSAQLKPFRRTQTKWNKVKAKAILGDIEFKAKAILGDVEFKAKAILGDVAPHNSSFLSKKRHLLIIYDEPYAQSAISQSDQEVPLLFIITLLKLPIPQILRNHILLIMSATNKIFCSQWSDLFCRQRTKIIAAERRVFG